MTTNKNVSDDYTILSEMSESVILLAKVIERGERFTVVKTAAALYTIPNDGIISVSRLKGEDEDLSEIRVKQDAKIVQKTLVSAAQIAGFRTVIGGGFAGGINVATDCMCTAQCTAQCCANQCCEQCCEQCCQCTGGISYQVFDPAVVAFGASAAFRRVLG